MALQPCLKIERIYVDSEIEHSVRVRSVLEKLQDVPVTIVTDRDRFLQETREKPLSQGKKELWLTQFKGPLLKPCPATSSDYLCCRYWTINAQTHCPLDCTYCILQNYLNLPLLTFYVNIEDVLKEIDELLQTQTGRLFRMGTGELTDSLALDPLTRVNEPLIQYALRKKMILEIKTKTGLIAHLPDIPKSNVLVSWSLNPDEFIKTEEFHALPLEKRLKTALEAVKKGYRLGFHLDPLLMFPAWEKRYKAALTMLTKLIPEKEVMWISLGSLRFPPTLKKVIEMRFPGSRITTSEFVKGLDGKMRYFRPARTELYKKIYGELRRRWPEVFIYFCMENKTVWQDVMGFSPENNSHLDFLFHESIAKRFPDLALPLARREYYQEGD